MNPYIRGKADFKRGLALSANPFPQQQAGSFKAWNEGWLDAFNEAKGNREAVREDDTWATETGFRK